MFYHEPFVKFSKQLISSNSFIFEIKFGTVGLEIFNCASRPLLPFHWRIYCSMITSKITVLYGLEWYPWVGQTKTFDHWCILYTIFQNFYKILRFRRDRKFSFISFFLNSSDFRNVKLSSKFIEKSFWFSVYNFPLNFRLNSMKTAWLK